MADWQTTSSEVVHKNPWYQVRRDELLNHVGKPMTYNVVELASISVVIVALNSAGEVLLQQIYRYPIKQTTWEIPAGHSDGEDLLAAAKRELREETGLISDHWQSLGLLYQATGIGNLPFTVFAAQNVHQDTHERDPDEDISHQQFAPIKQLESMILSGEIKTSPCLTAIYLARLHNLWETTN